MKRVIYFGNNNPFKHRRGVENVILFQKDAIYDIKKYYIFFDNEKKTKIFRWENIICIGIQNNKFKFIVLNLLLLKLEKKWKNNFIIHSHNPIMSFFYIKKTNLLTVHDGLYYQNKEKKHKLIKIFYFIEKIVYLKTEWIHFISEFSKKMSLFNKGKYELIYNTTPFERYNGMKIGNNIINDWDKDQIKIYVVRSIEDRARIDLLIELAMKRTDIQIKISGKGPLLEFYKNDIKRKKIKNIELIGYTLDIDVVNYYKSCDLVIVPAEYGEGFGLPIIEGYLFNKPVIASNVCAIPEIIINKDYLFENNLCSLDRIVKRYENNKYNNYYNKIFSKQIILSKYKKLYEKIYEKKRKKDV